jgi:hypothetical protein
MVVLWRSENSGAQYFRAFVWLRRDSCSRCLASTADEASRMFLL